MNELRFFAFACVLGGLLRVVSSFLGLNVAAEVLEVLYIVTDLFLILGLIGFYSVHRQNLFFIGHMGFAIAICSIAFIAGPETEIFGVSVYQVGSPIVGMGFLLLSINLISAKLCGLFVPIVFIASVVVGLVSVILGLSTLFVVAGLLFGIGFIGLGVDAWKNS